MADIWNIISSNYVTVGTTNRSNTPYVNVDPEAVLRVVDDPRDLRAREPVVDRDRRCAGEHTRERDLDARGAVLVQEGHPRLWL